MKRTAAGFSLVETMFAMAVLTTGLLGGVAVMARGVGVVSSAPRDLIATQKAAEAIESVFTARDTRLLTWAQIRNVQGYSGSDGGVFLDGDQPLKVAGTDGMVNTADDGAIESLTKPGPNGILNDADDVIDVLTGYQRKIEIRDLGTPINGVYNLRKITVTITYTQGPNIKVYNLITYISNYV